LFSALFSPLLSKPATSSIAFFVAEQRLTYSIAIKAVVPDVASPGDSVEIMLDRDLSKYAPEDLAVSFDNIPGKIIGVGGNDLKVQVPHDLRPRKNIWVVVRAGKFKTAPYRDFAVAAVVRTPSPPPQKPASAFESLRNNPLFLIAAVCIGGAIVFLLFWWLRKYLRRKQAMQREIEGLRLALEKRSTDVSPKPALTIESEQESQPREAPEPELPVPVVPAELVEACQKGECVVFAGADLNKAAGLPTWQEFVQGLLQWAMENKILDPSLEISYREALQSGQADLVADGVASAVQAGDNPARDLLLKYLQDVFRKSSAQPTPAHHLLKQIGFSGALTTNLDSLLEDALEAPVFTPLDVKELLPTLAKRAPFVLKLFGTLEKPETIQISPTRYRDGVADNRVLLEFVEKLFLSRTVLFIGTSMDGVQSNLEALRLRNMNRSHYALVGVSGREWQAKEVSFQQRFGVQILPHSVKEGDGALLNFLGVLATKVTRSRAATKSAPREPPYLKRVQLENIGPFETLDLRLDPRWNILLGDNGVGKSNILKAVALALCGKHAQRYADRLIKFGRPRGRIVLEFTDGAANVTELYRTSAEPEIKTLSQRELLGTERWLALGFPPLRQVGWTPPKGPQPRPGTPYTTPSDMLPLVTGDLDPRMDDLKQSIINFDYQALSDGGERSKNLLDDFFDVVDQMTPGVTFRRGSIDPKTFQIFVETDDGKVPLAAVSQGTQSMMGWVGLLLQRLYEVYDDAAHPKDQPALVLIDEIDAHMHPRWQQSIVHSLKELFPNAQFVATTHSPLIVAGMERREVRVVRRAGPEEAEAGHVVIEWPKQKLKGLRADQILTGSSLFHLESTLAPDLDAARRRYTTLAAKDSLTAEEQRELESLAESVEIRIPAPHEREVARMAFEKMQQALEQELTKLSPEERKKLMEEAKVQVQENVTGSRRP